MRKITRRSSASGDLNLSESYVSSMKTDILKVLNSEFNKAKMRAEEAKRHGDLVGILVEKRVIDIIRKLIKMIQDRG